MGERFTVVEAANLPYGTMPARRLGDKGGLFVIFDRLYGGPPSSTHASTTSRVVAELHCRALNAYNTIQPRDLETSELEMTWLEARSKVCHQLDLYLVELRNAGQLTGTVSLDYPGSGYLRLCNAIADMMAPPDQEKGT